MKTVHLDFLQHRAAPGKWAWVAFVLGLLVLLSVLVWRFQVAEALLSQADVNAEKRRVLQDSIAATRPKGRRLEGQPAQEEWNRAIKISNALNSPWSALFEALEGEVERPVALLSFEADAVRREVTLAAEARNFDEMLSFISFLKALDFLDNVLLHTHQINQQDRENPVRFRVTARWVEV